MFVNYLSSVSGSLLNSTLKAITVMSMKVIMIIIIIIITQTYPSLAFGSVFSFYF